MKEGDTKGDEHGGLFFSLGLVVIPVGRHSFSGGGGLFFPRYSCPVSFLFRPFLSTKRDKGDDGSQKAQIPWFSDKNIDSFLSTPPRKIFFTQKHTSKPSNTDALTPQKEKKNGKGYFLFLQTPS